MDNGAVATQCGRTSWRWLQVTANTSWTYAWFQTSDICALLGCYVAYNPIFKGQAQEPDPWRWDRQVVPKRRVHNYRSTLRKTPETRRYSADISRSANDHHNEVIPLVSPCYYQHTNLMQDTTTCFKILTHRENWVIQKIYFISLKNLNWFYTHCSPISEKALWRLPCFARLSFR